MRAAGLLGRVLDEFEATLQCRQTARDRRADFRQVPDRRDQHQHRGDEGHEIAHSDTTAVALPQRHGDHGGESGRGQQLGERRHGRHGDGGLERQPAQRHAQHIEALGLACLGAVQPHHAVGQGVFFHHIGEFVGGGLAVAGELVEAAREHPHDQDQAWKHGQHDQRELPVQVEQVAHQRDHREAVLGEREEGRHQHLRAGLHLVDQRVGQFARALAGKQRHLGIVELDEHGPAQVQQAQAGGVGQRVLRHETGHAADAEQPHERHGHHPQRDVALGETPVQQCLEQRRNHGLGGRAQQGTDSGERDAGAGGAEIRPQSPQALPDRLS
ncbi:hypothetical protein FQZ97_842150 [compost metagenome]